MTNNERELLDALKYLLTDERLKYAGSNLRPRKARAVIARIESYQKSPQEAMREARYG